MPDLCPLKFFPPSDISVKTCIFDLNILALTNFNYYNYYYQYPGFSLVFSTAGKRTFQTGKELLVNLSCFLVLPYAGQILFYKYFLWPYCHLFIHPKKKLYKIFFLCLKEIYLLLLT